VSLGSASKQESKRGNTLLVNGIDGVVSCLPGGSRNDKKRGKMSSAKTLAKTRAKTLALLASILVVVAVNAASAETKRPHNVILFVPDGLRALSVTPESAPTMADVRDKGVNFRNSHSVFPTFTTANASAMATGHHLGDTGDWSNTVYVGRPTAAAGNSVTPFLENDRVLGEVDQMFGGDYLNEETILKAARGAGLSTAAIGKLGPTLIFDHTERTGERTIIFDDSTGTPDGIPLSSEIKAALTSAGLPLATPGRGANGRVGDFKTPGTTVANVEQQGYFADVATKVVLPLLKARGKPFVLVYWSRDPDGTQHGQGDSLNELTPGINGPTSRAAIRNADDNLKRLRDALTELGLADSTNILIAADHGFSTVAKQSQTSGSAKATYADVPPGFLPPGFMSIDIAKGLGLSLYDPDSQNALVGENAHPRLRGNGLIGNDPAKPAVIVAANGGSDLIYLPNKDRATARRVIDILLAQDYVSGIFVDDDLGRFPATLPLSAVNLRGRAVTPRPAIVVNFRSFSTGCDQPVLCSATVADATQQQGQGMHGSFSRADTMNFMAAIGPDFKASFINPAPVSNADVGMTIARLLDLRIPNKGPLVGRVMREAMPNGRLPAFSARTLRSEADKNGLRTVLDYQQLGATRYLDAAGFPGRTVGLRERASVAGR
jgi:Type I phosphodiesterase / nucleotide pyrophosphatase